MQQKIKMTTIPITSKVDNIILKGELTYWAKDYAITLLEPFVRSCVAHLQYGIPVKYVIEISKNPTYIEINLLERTEAILQALYKEGPRCHN